MSYYTKGFMPKIFYVLHFFRYLKSIFALLSVGIWFLKAPRNILRKRRENAYVITLKSQVRFLELFFWRRRCLTAYKNLRSFSYIVKVRQIIFKDAEVERSSHHLIFKNNYTHDQAFKNDLLKRASSSLLQRSVEGQASASFIRSSIFWS